MSDEEIIYIGLLKRRPNRCAECGQMIAPNTAVIRVQTVCARPKVIFVHLEKCPPIPRKHGDLVTFYPKSKEDARCYDCNELLKKGQKIKVTFKEGITGSARQFHAKECPMEVAQ